MRQIFDFTGCPPPPLRESQLRRTLYARTRRRQILQLMLGSCLLLAAVFLLGLRLVSTAPLAAGLCLTYATVGLLGGPVVLHVFRKRKGAKKS